MSELAVPFTQEPEKYINKLVLPDGEIIYTGPPGVLPELKELGRSLEIIVDNRISKKVFRKVWDYLFTVFSEENVNNSLSFDATTTSFIFNHISPYFILDQLEALFNRVDLYRVILTPNGDNKWSISIKR